MTWQPDIVIYHSPCDDGFGAAWAAWKRWGDTIQYHGANYGQEPPDVTGMRVLIVDFSYKRPVLDAMVNAASSIVILDHHKTAADDLAPFTVNMCGGATLAAEGIWGMLRDLAELDRPPAIALFDMEKSGARLAWEFCHHGVPVPHLIAFIEDRDLWRFDLPDTKAISLLLRTLPFDFAAWSDLADRAGADLMSVIEQARVLDAFYRRQIERMLGGTQWRSIDGHLVPTVNCDGQFASDIGHRLLDLNPAAPFAATYSDRHGARGYSLRSADDRMDVSLIAKRYGGGGHRNAAGFEVPI